jgi:hypothetical protein
MWAVSCIHTGYTLGALLLEHAAYASLLAARSLPIAWSRQAAH